MKTELLIILGIFVTFNPLARGQSSATPVAPGGQLSISAVPPGTPQESQPGAQYPVLGGNSPFGTGLPGTSAGGGGGGGMNYWMPTQYADGESAVSIISFKDSDEKVMDETSEDLNILSLILSQNLERAVAESSDYKLGIPIVLRTSGHAVTTSYIEGFGAMFSLRVRFPLVAPQTQGSDNQNTGSQSQWEEARRALRGDADPTARSWRPSREVEPYDPKMVETLRKRAIELLRNASHLRHVKDDEWVVVNFFGPSAALGTGRGGGNFRASSAEDKQVERFVRDLDRSYAARTDSAAKPSSGYRAKTPDLPGKNDQQENPATAPESGTQTVRPDGEHVFRADLERSTVMTIRIRKGNATAVAANKMSEEEFSKEAEVSSHLAPISNHSGSFRRGL